MRGQGDVGPRGSDPGDLIVVLEEKEHPIFVRRGNDLLLELPISYTQAVLGDKVEVPVLGGKVRIQIPAGVQTGKVLRVRGKGMPVLNRGGRGDQLVRLHVWTPDRVGDAESKVLEQLREVETKPPVPGESEHGSSWFDRVRDAWSA